jgi:hypothetical protein
MRIIVKSDGHRFFIPLPSGLIFSRPSAALAYRIITSHSAEFPFTREQFFEMTRALRRARRSLRGTPIVEVDDKDGDMVRIYL